MARAASPAETIRAQVAEKLAARAVTLEEDAQALGHLPVAQEAVSECVAILTDAAASLRSGVPSGH